MPPKWDFGPTATRDAHRPCSGVRRLVMAFGMGALTAPLIWHGIFCCKRYKRSAAPQMADKFP